MSDLKKKIIKLAHDKPELRKHILPLLVTSGIRDRQDASDVLALVARKIEESIRAAKAIGYSPSEISVIEDAWSEWDLKALLSLQIIDRRLMRDAQEALDFLDNL